MHHIPTPSQSKHSHAHMVKNIAHGAHHAQVNDNKNHTIFPTRTQTNCVVVVVHSVPYKVHTSMMLGIHTTGGWCMARGQPPPPPLFIDLFVRSSHRVLWQYTKHEAERMANRTFWNRRPENRMKETPIDCHDGGDPKGQTHLHSHTNILSIPIFYKYSSIMQRHALAQSTREACNGHSSMYFSLTIFSFHFVSSAYRTDQSDTLLCLVSGPNTTQYIDPNRLPLNLRTMRSFSALYTEVRDISIWLF